VLRTFFGQSASQVVGLLDAASYQPGEIGWVVRSQFTGDPLVFVKAFADAGADITQTAQAAYVVFEQAFGRDSFIQANSVVAMLRQSFGPRAVATTVRSMFGIDGPATLQILADQRYVARQIADVARNVCNTTAQETAKAFDKIGIVADDAARALTAVYREVNGRTIATYLQAVSDAKSALNSVLGALGNPGI